MPIPAIVLPVALGVATYAAAKRVLDIRLDRKLAKALSKSNH